MPSAPFIKIAAATLLLALAACDMPTEPAGIHEEGLTHIAGRLHSQGDDAGAVDFYQRALQRKPDDVDAMTQLGGILESHGQVEAAEGYYAKALQIKPDHLETLYAEGRVLIRLGRAEAARDVYQRILDDHSHDSKAENGLGIALDYLGAHEEAQSHYRAALETAPNDLATINNLAHSYVLSGRTAEAVQLLEPHARDLNATPALRQNLAEAYGLSGMFTDAERMARVDLKPADVKRNMAYYHARYAKLATAPALTAELGSYPTKEMAEAQADILESLASGSGVTISAFPVIQTIGGTPSFVVRTSAFADAGNLSRFCQKMAEDGHICTPGKGP